MSPLYSIVAAAKVLGVSPSWLREQVRGHRVPHTRIGTHVRFTEEHLAEIVEAGQSRPAVSGRGGESPTGRRRRSHPAAAGVPGPRRPLGA